MKKNLELGSERVKPFQPGLTWSSCRPELIGQLDVVKLIKIDKNLGILDHVSLRRCLTWFNYANYAQLCMINE